MKIFSKLVLLMITVCLSCDSEDQFIVETGELSYFPLQVGYRWEYEPIRTDVPGLISATFKVVSQETKHGIAYFAMERQFERCQDVFSTDTIFYRVDGQGFVYEVTSYDPVERNRFRLGANDGDTWEMENSGLQNYQVTTTVTDVTLSGGIFQSSKSFFYDAPQLADEEHYLILAQGIGIVQHGNAWGFDFKLKSAHLSAITN